MISINYIYWLCKWSQQTATVHSKCSKISPSTSMHFSTLLATVNVALLRSSWRSCCMRAALFIMRAANSSLVFTFSLYTSLFIHPHRQKSDLYAPNSNSCIFTPTENWTLVYMNLFTRNSPYYHLIKYLHFLLKHPVCVKKNWTIIWAIKYATYVIFIFVLAVYESAHNNDCGPSPHTFGRPCVKRLWHVDYPKISFFQQR